MTPEQEALLRRAVVALERIAEKSDPHRTGHFLAQALAAQSKKTQRVASR